jgi:hypothetical protein
MFPRREFEHVCVRKHGPCLNEAWDGRCEPSEPADKAGGEKPQLNAGNLALKGGVAHTVRRKE